MVPRGPHGKPHAWVGEVASMGLWLRDPSGCDAGSTLGSLRTMTTDLVTALWLALQLAWLRRRLLVNLSRASLLTPGLQGRGHTPQTTLCLLA